VLVGDIQDKLKKAVEVQKNVKNLKVMVTFPRTSLTGQYFSRVQEMVVLIHHLTILPYNDIEEIPQIFNQLAIADRRPNPFLTTMSSTVEERKRRENIDLLHCVCRIPGTTIKEQKARKLLANNDFNTLRKISRARSSQLTAVLGSGLAIGVDDFFRKSNKI